MCLALAACAGTPFEWDEAAKIHDGMTEDQIVSVLGKPYARSQQGAITVLTYSYASGFGGARAVSYRLVNGRVVGTSTVGK